LSSSNWPKVQKLKRKRKEKKIQECSRAAFCNHNYDQTTAWLIPGWITSWIKFDFFRKRLPSPLACWKWNICCWRALLLHFGVSASVSV
jgi:hypothetical protein